MNAYHANKGGHMATLKDQIEQALMDLIDEGKLVIKGPDGEEMEDMSIEIKAVEEDIYDDEDESEEDDGDDRE